MERSQATGATLEGAVGGTGIGGVHGERSPLDAQLRHVAAVQAMSGKVGESRGVGIFALSLRHRA